MAGHSHWAQIKHKKAAKDAKRGKIFSKLVREIIVAVRQGGPDPEMNPRLRLALEKAKQHNLPKDNIERAIKKATGADGGADAYEEVIYEGYGPGGVAFVIKTVTDNKNRTVNEIRHIFSKHGGNLATSGSVLWQFEEKGIIYIPQDATDEDTLMEIALDAGADDLTTEAGQFVVYTSPRNFSAVKEAIEKAGIPISSAQVTMISKNTIHVEGDMARKVLKLYEALEEHDDVQEVYANFDIAAEELEALAG